MTRFSVEVRLRHKTNTTPNETRIITILEWQIMSIMSILIIKLQVKCIWLPSGEMIFKLMSCQNSLFKSPNETFS